MKHMRALYQWVALLSVIIFLGGQFSPASAQTSAQVGVFQAYEIQPGARVEIPIEIRNVKDLYAVDLEIHYDPQILTFEDANPQLDGIQPALGTFLDAGMVLYNTVDPEAGIIRFVMTQVNPSEPKSGSGVLIVLYAVGAAEGESQLDIVKADLSTRDGIQISAEMVRNKVKVSANASEVNATPIPVQNPTSIIIVPTLAPMAASTTTPLPTKPAPTQTPYATEEGQTQTAVITKEAEIFASPTTVVTEVVQGGGFSLVQNWWILLIVFAAIVGMVIYLNTGKKQPPEEKQEEGK